MSVASMDFSMSTDLSLILENTQESLSNTSCPVKGALYTRQLNHRLPNIQDFMTFI